MKVPWICFLMVAISSVAAAQSNTVEESFRESIRKAKAQNPRLKLKEPSDIKMVDPSKLKTVNADLLRERVREIEKSLGRSSTSSSTRLNTKNRVRSTSTGPATVPQSSLAAPKEPRIIEDGLLEGVAIGAGRGEVIAQLGDPSKSFVLAGLPGGNRETLTYNANRAGQVSIVLVDDRVVQIQGR